MDRWLKLDPTRYVGGRDEKSGCTSYRAVNSPYDIPEAIKCSFDSRKNVLTIEFQYLVEERPMMIGELKANDEVIRLFVGSTSGRLLKIESDTGTAGPKQFHETMRLVDQISQLIRSKKREVRSSELASQVLEENFAKLVQ